MSKKIKIYAFIALFAVFISLICFNVSAINPYNKPGLNIFVIPQAGMTKIPLSDIYELGYNDASIVAEINNNDFMYEVLTDVSGTFSYYTLDQGRYVINYYDYASGGYNYDFKVYGAFLASFTDINNVNQRYLVVSWAFTQDDEIVYNWNNNISPSDPSMIFYYDDQGITFQNLNQLQKLIIANSTFIDYRLGAEYNNFDYFDLENYYQNGYSRGYDDAYSDAWTRYNEELIYLQENYDDSLEETFNNGKLVGYAEGYGDGAEGAENYTFHSLINAIFTVPTQWIFGLLNFDFLGINMQAVFYFFLTLMLILGVVHFIKRYIK